MNNNIKGLLLVIFGMLLFIVHDTLIKLTVNDLSLLQILTFRAIAGSLILIIYLLYTKQIIVFSSAYPYIAVFRGVSFFFGFLLFFISLSKIGLAEATSLFFVSPFFITIFSYLILKNSGYSRYEISNYCLPRHQSRHNRVYWSGLGWWSFGQGSTSSPWGEKFTRPRVSKEYKEWVIRQYELNLDSSLTNKEFVYKELDEKIMLGLRLKEGVDIKELFKELNWENKKFESNFRKLLEKWERFLESGLLVRKGNRFFLSEPKGMELSNQVLVSMFRWWDEIN